VYPDQAGACHHLDVVGATAAHPDVADGHEGQTVGSGPLDHGTRRVVHPQHAALVAAVVEHRDARFLDDAQRAAGKLEAGIVGDVEQLGQPGILVAAQGRVDRVVGEDAGLLGVVPDPTHGALGQLAGVGDAQVNPFRSVGPHAKRILPPS